MKGRDAGQDVGNDRYLGGVAGKLSAVAGSLLLVSPMSGARVPTVAPILVSTARDVAVGNQRQLLQFHLTKGGVIILPHLGLHELNRTFAVPMGVRPRRRALRKRSNRCGAVPRSWSTMSRSPLFHRLYAMVISHAGERTLKSSAVPRRSAVLVADCPTTGTVRPADARCRSPRIISFMATLA